MRKIRTVAGSYLYMLLCLKLLYRKKTIHQYPVFCWILLPDAWISALGIGNQ
jgi:hypothetical protein